MHIPKRATVPVRSRRGSNTSVATAGFKEPPKIPSIALAEAVAGGNVHRLIWVPIYACTVHRHPSELTRKSADVEIRARNVVQWPGTSRQDEEPVVPEEAQTHGPTQDEFKR